MTHSVPHVLFLNAQDQLGADVAVHLMLARTLDRQKVRVSAATSLIEAPGVSARRSLESMSEVTLLPLNLGRPIGKHHGLARASATLDNVLSLTNLITLARWCRDNRVDIVHVTERPRQALFGLMVARMARCACLIHAHTVCYPGDATWFSKWRLHQAAALVGVSDCVADSYRRRSGLAADQVFTVHNGVDATKFRPEVARAARDSARQRLGIAQDAIVIGCVARLMQSKDQPTLIEAFASVRARLPRAHLVLAGTSADQAPDGNGDYRDYLLRRIAALGLEDAVTLPGFILQTEMPEFYGALDILAHPSLEEPCSLALLEAMAAERSIVAVNSGGTPELIRNGTDGMLVPPRDPLAMAEAIMGLISNPDLARNLGLSARARALSTFTPQRQAETMVDVYRQITASRRQTPTGPSLSRAA